MDTLHRYYTVYNRFVANPSNLHFKIQYTEPDSDQSETTQFTNTDSLTPENVKEYGRYAYLPGNSGFLRHQHESDPAQQHFRTGIQ